MNKGQFLVGCGLVLASLVVGVWCLCAGRVEAGVQTLAGGACVAWVLTAAT